MKLAFWGSEPFCEASAGEAIHALELIGRSLVPILHKPEPERGIQIQTTSRRLKAKEQRATGPKTGRGEVWPQVGLRTGLLRGPAARHAFQSYPEMDQATKDVKMFRYLTFTKPGSSRSFCLNLTVIAVLTFVSMLFVQQAHASAQATVAWNADSAQVAGYDVYYGTSSGNYTTTLNAGNTTSTTLQNLSAQTYYIALTAFNSSNVQSGYSPELVVDSLTASAGSGGTISPSGTFFQSQGGSQTFTITPSAGYTTANVLVDGTSVGAVSSYTLSNITANHTVSATFAATPTSYSLTASAGANGSISPSGSVAVKSGANQTFSFTPATGYKVSSVLVDGTAVTAASSYTFTNVTASHTISVSFAPATNTCTITASAGSNGSISPSGSVAVNSGGNQTFTVTANSGYHIADVVVDGTHLLAQASPFTYTFSNVKAAHTIAASFGRQVNVNTVAGSL